MTASHSLISWLHNRGPLFCAVMLMAMSAGCGSTSISDPVALDKQIEEKWLAGREMVDAIEFLERGGQYENLEIPDAAQIDQDHVLPLLKSIRDELSLNPMAVLLTPERAMAILIDNPSAPAKRNRLRDLMQAADDKFPGLLIDNWGEKWLSLDFLDEREVGVLKSSGSFEPLQKELEFQRRQRN